jgi:hypothetical protein
MTFWERVRSYANAKVRAAHMAKYHHERRCPCCNTWTSEVGGAAAVKDEGNGFEVMQCKRCSTWSRWDYRSGLIIDLAEPWQVETLPST